MSSTVSPRVEKTSNVSSSKETQALKQKLSDSIMGALMGRRNALSQYPFTSVYKMKD